MRVYLDNGDYIHATEYSADIIEKLQEVINALTAFKNEETKPYIDTVNEDIIAPEFDITTESFRPFNI